MTEEKKEVATEEKEVKDVATDVNPEPEKEDIEVIDEKGRAIHSRWELSNIYRVFSGLSGQRDPKGQVVVDKKLSGQPSYSAGRDKNKIRSIVEELDETRQLPQDSDAMRKGSKRQELISQYGTADAVGNIIFSTDMTTEERAEFRESLLALDKKYPEAEAQIIEQNKKLKSLGNGKVKWNPFLMNIEPQLGKLTPDEWEIVGQVDDDGKFLFLKGTDKDLEDALETYKEDERKAAKKKREKED